MLELDHIKVTFPLAGGGSLTALDDVSFSVKKGELVALVGPSGCGKSTCLNVLAGQVSPIAGTVKTTDGAAGYISQADTLLPWRTVLDNVALAMELRGVPKKQRREKAAKLMQRMGLSGFEDQYPRQLSGGMKKRAAIARVLATSPSVLMMDEPFAPLDAMTREKLQDEILQLRESAGMTILYVTHDIPEAITLADRVLLMTARPGRVFRAYAIDLPRPRRAMEVKFTPQFIALEKAIRQDLQAQGEGAACG